MTAHANGVPATASRWPAPRRWSVGCGPPAAGRFPRPADRALGIAVVALARGDARPGARAGRDQARRLRSTPAMSVGADSPSSAAWLRAKEVRSDSASAIAAEGVTSASAVS